MIAMTRRNIKVFFRDKTAVFFSLLSVLIIIGLYVLFLGDMMERSMPGLPGVRFLMDSWIMSGMLAVTAMTATMGAFGIMVEDRAKNMYKDFAASPLSRRSLAGGYILGAYIIGVIMTVLAFVFAQVYIAGGGGSLLPLSDLPPVLGCILLAVLASSAMVFLMVSCFKSMNAFATASTILGTMIGFLTGVYIPVGNLPAAVQTVVKIFPVSHAGALFRQMMMRAPMRASLSGAPDSEVRAFEEMLGIRFFAGEEPLPAAVHLAVLAATTLVFYGLAVWNISRKKS